jgi:hypothetical protein
MGFDGAIDPKPVSEEITDSCQALLPVENDLFTIRINHDVNCWHVPLAQDGVDKSLPALNIPYLAALKVRL